MNMKLQYILLPLLLLFIFSNGSMAQKWKLKRYEGIVGIGTAHYFGDIGGTADETNLFGLKDVALPGGAVQDQAQYCCQGQFHLWFSFRK
jgi:hypothetical protein